MDASNSRLGESRSRGFTLVELMVGIAIIAIGLTVAVPSFNDMIARNRVATQVNDLILAINTARSEASRTGSTVSLQAIGTDGGNEFGEGYCVVAGTPGNCNGTLIRSFPALTGGSTLDSVEDVTVISFSPLGGVSAGVPRQFDLCADSTAGRRIYVSPVGRSKSHAPDDPDATRRPGC